jgi:hypothetical protein
MPQGDGGSFGARMLHRHGKFSDIALPRVVRRATPAAPASAMLRGRNDDFGAGRSGAGSDGSPDDDDDDDEASGCAISTA